MCEACASGHGRLLRESYSRDPLIAQVDLDGVRAAFKGLAWRAQDGGGGTGSESADTIFLGGPIVTVDERQPQVEAMAIQGGRITALGSRDVVLQRRGAKTEVIDLGGHTLMPGFVEPHVHLAFSALSHYESLDVSPLAASTKDAAIAILKHAAESQPAGSWIQAFGYDPSRLPPDYTGLTAADLDLVSTSNPIMVTNQSGHIAYVNHRAFDIAGITDATPNPAGGTYVKDANGHLTGELFESPSFAAFTATIPRLAPTDVYRDCARMLGEWARVGCTTMYDGGLGLILQTGEFKLFTELAADPSTPVRLRGALVGGLKLVDQLDLKPNQGNDRFRVNGIKFWADGSTQGFTGAVNEPYLNGKGTGTLNYPTDEALHQSMEPYQKAGWQIMVHSNGDRATDQVLRVFEQMLGSNPGPQRHRIDHFTVTNEDQQAKTAQLGLNVSHTIGHVYYWGRTFRDYVLGPERARRIDAFASDLKHGLRVSMHSDSPVSPVAPLRFMQTAVSREMQDGGVLGPEQCVPVEEAIKAVTLNAARHACVDDIAGNLEVGKMADLVVLDADPRSIDPSGIAQITVLQTYLAGERKV